MPSTSSSEPHQLLEINIGKRVHSVTFTANGKHLVCGTEEGVQVWRIEGGKRLGIKMPMQSGARCIAISRDGRWIAAGSFEGGLVLVWDAINCKQVFADTMESIQDVDFSPDSSRLVYADSHLHHATIWDIATRRKVQTLSQNWVVAAKYSPRGDQIATANYESVWVWDSDDGGLLVTVKAQTLTGRRVLLWRNDHLFVTTRDGKIKQINASTGSAISEWSAPDVSCIALQQHGSFIAYSAKKTVTFLDTSTSTQRADDIRSITFSSDGQLIAIVAERKITLEAIPSVASRFVLAPVERNIAAKDTSSVMFRPISEPEFDVDASTLDAWKHDKLTDAEALLTKAISMSQSSAHHVLACRALVRARLGDWDAALVDANQSIEIERSLVAYVAKCVTLVGKGEKDEGIRVCDIAFEHFHLQHVSFLLLIKAVILFVAGDHVEALSRMNDLITDSAHASVDPALYTVQAYMHLFLGNKHMQSNDHECAIQSFEDARVKLGNITRQPPLIVSLISGWYFDNLATTIKQRLCEALLAAGRTKEAVECVMGMFDAEIGMTEPIKTWVYDFKHRCRGKLQDLGDDAMNAEQYDEAISQYTVALSLNPATSQDLLVRRSNAWTSKGARQDALNDTKEWAKVMLTSASWENTLAAAVGFIHGKSTTYRVVCEHLEMTDRFIDAIACFRQMSHEQAQEMDKEQANWVQDFKSRCHDKLEKLGDVAADAKQYDNAISQYTLALSLDSADQQELLIKRSNAQVGKGRWKDALDDAKGWVRLMLVSGSWRDTVTAAGNFILDKFAVYREVCERLEMTGQVADAVACFHQMSGALVQKKTWKQKEWIRDFKARCCGKLEGLGDSAANAARYDDAISQYNVALSLGGVGHRGLLIKRSKAYTEQGMWEDALNDANKVVELDPSSPSGYERKHAALLGMERHQDAIDAFETMLLKMSESSESEIRERSCHYVWPEETKDAIRTSIQSAIHDSPLVLINISSGRLCNKSEQAAAFESTPAFMTLVASTITRIDYALIEQAVGKFYRYATFSHTWEGHESIYESIVSYGLEALATHDEPKMFCQIVRDEGFNWAWSDVCCIDKGDQIAHQEALVNMFRWYEGSAMTIIFLCDVDELAELGALTSSLWNSRAWSLQEYHASKVVRFYTKNWTPYLGLTIYNHKESPEIISEMEKVTGISAQALTALRPGLEDIREKLRLASTRQTMLVEDVAYSLFGIFSLTLPVAYGEGDKALGRLLSQLLTSSGDTSVLAWTGRPGSFNSCLPTDIVVFSQSLTPYIPPTIPDTEMVEITAALRAASLDPHLVKIVYDQLNELPSPSFVIQRMKLPCLAFKIRTIIPFRKGSEVVFRAQADALGAVEIKARQNIAQADSLYLVHPWINVLLDRRAAGNTSEALPHEDDALEFDELPALDSLPEFSSTLDGDLLPDDTQSTPSPTASLMDAQMEFLARLRQPFGALLLAPTRRNGAEFRRIVTESVITVQVQEITSATLNVLIQCVRVLDVL